MRIGHGFDVHAFGGGKPLILGGIRFDAHPGLLAHSDGDVLLHAICDSLLGAIGEGDIGRHFPDTEAKFAGADSQHLLTEVWKMVTARHYRLENLDLTVIAETPKMASRISLIRANIARILQCEPERINVKATTSEQLGYIGRKEGIAVHAVVLLCASKPSSTADTSANT